VTLDILTGVLTMNKYGFEEYRPVLVRMIQNSMNILRKEYNVTIESYVDDLGLVVSVFADRFVNRTIYMPESFGAEWDSKYPYSSINKIHEKFVDSVIMQISSIKAGRIIKWGKQ